MADTERDLTIETADAAPIDAAKGAEIMEKFEKESRTRNFSFQPLVKAGYILCLFFTLYHLVFASGMMTTQNIKHHAIHVGLVLILGFLYYPAFKKSSRKKVAWYDWICVALSAAMPCYVFYRYLDWTSTGFRPTQLDIIMGTLLILLVMECSRRISGPALTILSAIFLIYGMYGRYFPSVFQHRGYTWTRMVQYLTCDISGIYGSSVKVSATFIVLFIIFGEVMNKCGMGQFFNDIANSLAGHTKGGPAKVAVLASALMGMINGSAIANVATTGTITIPLMKQTGYKKEFAGAVEAVASTGGQFCPPIMGAVGFVMAEFLNLSYTYVMLAAVVPALLYYLGLLFAVHFEARRLGLSGLAKENIPDAMKVLREQGHLVIPLVVLIALMFMGYTPLYAAVIAIAATVAASWLRKDTRMTWDKIVAATVEGARGAVSVGVCCIIIGVIIGTVTLTSLGLNMGYLILSVVENTNIYITGLLVMIMSTILGMGVPGVAAYVIVQAVAVPVLIEVNVLPISAHMFCLIYACLSNITPPVAMSSYVAAGIAGSNQTKTGLLSVRLGLVGFLIPFFFLDNPVLLIGADPDATLAASLWAVFTACVGTVALVGGLEGWLLRKASWPERAVLIAVAPLMLYPGPLTDAAGFAMLGAVAAFQHVTRRPAALS